LGFKDFQQLKLIKLHVKKNGILTKVISCPTIRGKNGIALSSRNSKLNKNQVKIAAKVYKYLKGNKKKIISKNLTKEKIIFINDLILLGVNKIDYLESLNLKTLKKTKTIKEVSNIFIAYYLGRVRLIDNL